MFILLELLKSRKGSVTFIFSFTIIVLCKIIHRAVKYFIHVWFMNGVCWFYRLLLMFSFSSVRLQISGSRAHIAGQLAVDRINLYSVLVVFSVLINFWK